MHRYALRDDQWDKIKDFLPGREGHVGGTAADNRLFVDAVVVFEEDTPAQLVQQIIRNRLAVSDVVKLPLVKASTTTAEVDRTCANILRSSSERSSWCSLSV